MSLLNLLGLDDLADGINEFTSGFDQLKGEFIDSIVGPSEDLKSVVDDISGSITGGSSETPTE